MQQLIDIYGSNNGLWSQAIYDAGRNQIQAVIAFLPLTLDETPVLIKLY